MYKRIIGIIMATMVAVGLATTVAGSASAETPDKTPHCLTKTEWQRIHKGMTRAQVTRIAGFAGRLDDYTLWGDGTKSTWVNYRQCLPNGKPAAAWSYTFMQYDNYKYDYDYDTYIVAPFVNYKGSWGKPYAG